MQPSDPRFAWKKLDGKARVEVLRLAQKGQRHPNPAVADAAYRWAHHDGWNRLSNRLPGWLLPVTGVALAGLFLVAGLYAPGIQVLSIGAVFAAIVGLLGWNAAAAARQVRIVYPSLPAAAGAG